MGSDRLTWFNQLPAEAARQQLLACCAAPAWAEPMAAARPYASAEDAVRRSAAIVATLPATDLAHALAGHPRIGELAHSPEHAQSPERAHSRGTPEATDWSSREQSGIDADDAATKRALAAANREYEQRFGHIYLVCASGRTGKELLDVLRTRLQNDPGQEWQVVRAELQKINALRLQQLTAGSP
jgi:2-oxo-4-hydroxy-4-carboxy-5-ureidoimidazoline decarboxylase